MQPQPRGSWRAQPHFPDAGSHVLLFPGFLVLLTAGVLAGGRLLGGGRRTETGMGEASRGPRMK